VLTYYCPNCWAIIANDAVVCSECGYQLDHFEKLSYEDKLLAAIHHSVSERRNMAVQVLGNLGSQHALPKFLEIIENETDDYFLLRAVLLSTSKINHPLRLVILTRATLHSSPLICELALELLDQLHQHGEIPKWDRHTD